MLSPHNPSGDYNDASPTAPGVIMPVIAGIVAAAIGPLIWVGCYQFIGNVWMPALLIGLLVGLAMRWAGKSSDRRLSIVAAIATVLSCFAGYLWTDLYILHWTLNGQPVQPTFADACKRFLNDLFSIVLIAIGAYIAFTIAIGSREEP